MITRTVGIARIEQKARISAKEVYTSLYHHVYNKRHLELCFDLLKKDSALGIDGVSVADYRENLNENLEELSSDLSRMSYIPQPSKRVYIPKVGSAKGRPLGIPCTEDKLVQKAVKEVLEPIYEVKFRDTSFGYRGGISAHDALDALGRCIQQKKVSYVVEADIKGFFNHVNHDILMELLNFRIKDQRLLRLIKRMLKAGIMENGLTKADAEGTPQGSILSPLLSNIYLHYALDLWFEKSFRPQCRGEIYFFRYADDFVACFQYKSDAELYLNQMKERLARYSLEVEPSKTRMIEFGRFASANAKKNKQGKPETFDFLGFTHYCGKTRFGTFSVKRRTSQKKFSSKLKEFNQWLQAKRSWIKKRELIKTSVRKINGHLNYFCITDNTQRCQSFAYEMKRILYKWLNRQSQRRSYNWGSFSQALIWYKWPAVRLRKKLSPFSKEDSGRVR